MRIKLSFKLKTRFLPGRKKWKFDDFLTAIF